MKIEISKIKNLKGKIKNNLISTKAEKGNTILIMNKNKYRNKTEVFIH